MAAISDARSALYAALQTAVSASPWRVQRVSPAQIAAPTVFIDSPTLVEQDSIVTITFPVVIISDGAVRAQIEALDDLLVAVWTAAVTVGRATRSNPVALDVGGPSLRAQVLNVDIAVAAITLCAPTLQLTGVN